MEIDVISINSASEILQFSLYYLDLPINQHFPHSFQHMVYSFYLAAA